MIHPYGSVFISKCTTSKAEQETTKLSSVFFSRIDHKLYDATGKIHPLHQQLQGSPFSLRFSLPRHEHDSVMFQGTINMPFKFGEVSIQDFENVAITDKKDLELLRSLDFLRNSEVPPTLIKANVGGMIAAHNPGLELSAIKFQRIFYNAFFLFDDFLDEGTYKSLSFYQLELFSNLTRGILLEGKEFVADEFIALNLPTVFLKVANHVDYFNAELKKQLEPYESSIFLRQAIQDYLYDCCLGSCKEWQDQFIKNNPIIELQVIEELSLTSGGTLLSLELILFDGNVRLKKDIRDSFLCKWFMKLCAKRSRWLNDLVSYSKEMKEGVFCNLVYIYHVVEGRPLESVMQKVIDNVNHLAKMAVEFGELLCELHPNNTEVRRFVDSCKGYVYGDTQWYGFTKRYEPSLLFDCVIDVGESHDAAFSPDSAK